MRALSQRARLMTLVRGPASSFAMSSFHLGICLFIILLNVCTSFVCTSFSFINSGPRLVLERTNTVWSFRTVWPTFALQSMMCVFSTAPCSLLILALMSFSFVRLRHAKKGQRRHEREKETGARRQDQPSGATSTHGKGRNGIQRYMYLGCRRHFTLLKRMSAESVSEICIVRRKKSSEIRSAIVR